MRGDTSKVLVELNIVEQPKNWIWMFAYNQTCMSWPEYIGLKIWHWETRNPWLSMRLAPT